MTTKFIFIRHGITDWNVARRYQGQTDIPLNETGRQQAKVMADQLRDIPIHIIYCSDLARASETAEIIAAGRGIPIIPTSQIRETHFGQWEGLTNEEIHQRFPEQVIAMKNDPIHAVRPGGESRELMYERVRKSILNMATKHKGQTLGVVSHQGAIAAAVCALTGEEFDEGRKKYRLDNTAYHIIELSDDKWHVRHKGEEKMIMNIS